eukprot:CAMPEP_0171773058 /NCGR_PEP_ID=MMETSP0991-20121206/55073_1 /TAXON_ID=483369 /ORGANISM="non described non described, Strain CCMP2098" /LENGTH=505 /DNA_ID=CAMNT_0012378735 /DNA_START=284 /DNA_END=1801 /DNA_ORIENTATION=+
MTKPSVIAAFRSVPRGFFVPESAQGSAYDDAPLRHGCVHLSAPHIYGAIGDALDMHKGMSFLNIGSGTGYISTIAAVIGGPTSLNHGIEIDEECHRFSVERIAAFKALHGDTLSGEMADVNLVHGNVFDMEELLEGAMIGGCECYDRIYVGASCPSSLKDKLLRSLTLGGLLVAPVGDELLKIRRVDILDDHNYATPPRSRRSSVSSGSSDEAMEFNEMEARTNFAASFSTALLSGVRFVELTPSALAASSASISQVSEEEQRSRSSSISSEATSHSDSSAFSDSTGPLVKRRARLPTPLWSPKTHVVFPVTFKRSALALMVMTTSRRFTESLPGSLPRALWLEILSFTSRSWFTPPPSEVDRLRLRLTKESEARAEAEKALHEATRARRMAERECERYRLLAQQLEQRLTTAMNSQDQRQEQPSTQSVGWLGHFFEGLAQHYEDEGEDEEEEDDDGSANGNDNEPQAISTEERYEDGDDESGDENADGDNQELESGAGDELVLT